MIDAAEPTTTSRCDTCAGTTYRFSISIINVRPLNGHGFASSPCSTSCTGVGTFEAPRVG